MTTKEGQQQATLKKNYGNVSSKQEIKLPDKEHQTMLIKEYKAPSKTAEFVMRPATMEDLESAVTMFNRCSMVMISEPETSLSEVRTEWSLPEFNLETNTRVIATPRNRVIGYIEVWDIDELPVDMWVWGRVDPDFEYQGLGTHLMAWAENRAREAVERVPEGIRVIMRSGAYSNHELSNDFLTDFGLTPIRYFNTMSIDLDGLGPLPKWPAGITVRSMSGEEEIADIVRAVRDAFQDHWGHTDQPFEQELKYWTHSIQNDEDFDPKLYFLAMDGDEIAGVSLCAPKSNGDFDSGWVRTLGVRRQWRRQGLGLAMLHHSFNEFYRRGKKRVGLGVDSDSLTGATKLYEKAGMKKIRQFNLYEKELRPGKDISKQSL